MNNYEYDRFMREEMRQAEIVARRKFEEMESRRYVQPTYQQQPAYQQPQFAPENNNNAVHIPVENFEQAKKYKVHSDGDTMFFENTGNGELYVKWLNEGSGLWEMREYILRPAPEPPEQLTLDDEKPEKPEKPDIVEVLYSKFAELLKPINDEIKGIKAEIKKVKPAESPKKSEPKKPSVFETEVK